MSFILKFLKSLLFKLTISVLAIIIFTVFVPIGVILLSPVLLFRLFLLKFSKWLRPDLGKMLSSISSALGSDGIYNTSYAFTSIFAMKIEGILDVQEVRKEIEKNGINARFPKTGELMYPELKQEIVIWLGFLFWKPVPDFKIEDHVYEWENTADIRLKNTDSVEEKINLLCRKPWIKGRPVWEFIIIPQEDIGKTLCVYRMHHAMGDGYSILKLLCRFFGYNNPMEKLAKPNYIQRTPIQRFLYSLLFIFKVPYEAVEVFWHIFKLNTKYPFLLTEEQKKETRIYSAYSQDISLEFMKSIKNQHGVDFTSLVFAIVSGGCREMLIKYHGGVSALPKETLMSLPVPMPGHPDKLRNYVAVGGCIIAIAEENPVKRLKKIQREWSKFKSSTIPLANFTANRLVAGFPTKPLQALRQDTFFPAFGLSNILAPNEPYSVTGHLVEQVYTASNLCGAVLPSWWFMLVTYNGTARLHVSGLTEFLPSNEHARELMDFCIKEMHTLAQTTSSNLPGQIENKKEIIENIKTKNM